MVVSFEFAAKLGRRHFLSVTQHFPHMSRDGQQQRLAATDARSGRERLLQLVGEAQRFHDAAPASKRKTVRRTPSSSCASSASTISAGDDEFASTNGVEPWGYLTRHVEYFWKADVSPEAQRYAKCMDWLGTLQLWDATLTWKQVEPSANIARRRAHRRETVLASIPTGCFFL